MSDAPGYQGFVAGVFSGVTKLAVGHPFDTIKVRMQTNTAFRGPLQCLTETLKHEGLHGLYKGASPPLVGWMFMDSVMLGSLHNYRRLLKQKFWPKDAELPFRGKVAAGVLAGWTVSFVAAPIEHVKALLQVQYAGGSSSGAAVASSARPQYSGPIDCARQLIRNAGVFRGLYHGLFATMLFRTNFAFWWGSYDIFTKWMEQHTNMSTPVVNFWAGGLSASVFWTTAYPSDVVKQQIMTDNVLKPRYPTWMSAARAVYARGGIRGFFRGFVPSILRSFPANASALAAFEASMRIMNPKTHQGECLEQEVVLEAE